MKEKRITAPEGCEIEKVEIVDGVAVVTFKEKKPQLPKSWAEFCEMYPIKDCECYISSSGIIKAYLYNTDLPREIYDKNILPDRATAKAVLSLCQLIQLRDCYNGDFVPDWSDYNQDKYIIEFYGNEISCDMVTMTATTLYFKTEDLRDEFLLCFQDLIEKLKPLYGIKEGGEQ